MRGPETTSRDERLQLSAAPAHAGMGNIIRSDAAGIVEPIIFSCDIGSVEILAGFIPANFLVTNPFLLCVTPWDIPGTTIHLRFLLG